MKTRTQLFFLAILFLFQATSHSQSCVQEGTNYFTCGVPTEEFEYMQATSVNGGDQIQSNWCWAACVQMVLNYHGLLVSQMDVVTRIYGSVDANEPANEEQILYALSGWAPDLRGSFSAIHAYGGGTTIDEIVNGLSGKWPLIVGLSNPNGGVGHAYVLTAISFSYLYDYYGNVIGYLPDKVVLRDPWPDNESRQEWSWTDFANRQFMIVKTWVTRY